MIAGCVLLLLGLSAGIFLAHELRTSRLQARYLTRVAKELEFWMEPGPSPSICFPLTGPYDRRLGYKYLPAYMDELTTQGYTIEAQARMSPRLLELTHRGLFAIYREKTQTGLRILDRDDQVLYVASYPERVYRDFDAIPDRVIQTLLFIENRELLDPRFPHRNPAVEWDRLANAVLHMGVHLVARDHNVPGGSTLATQIEKFRHSPEGRTSSVEEKFRQIVSASLRAYLNGEETLEARRRIILDYINSIPLGAVPGYGEVIGLGDGLWGWYGVDFDGVNRSLSRTMTPIEDPNLTTWALAYKQMLSLFLAQRRPSFYLIQQPDAIEAQTNEYLRVLAKAGVISSVERDAALQAKLSVRKNGLRQGQVSFVERKAANAIRPRLLTLLDVPQQLYMLDRFDLTVQSTLDRRTQEEVTRALRQLCHPVYAEAAGLRGFRLLQYGDPANVVYSFTLYERVSGANLLRIQIDTFDQPFNVNEGIKIELGSSAKLRTLITYLEIIADLHRRYAGLSPAKRRNVSISDSDRLSQWAMEYLLRASDTTLPAMLEAAMERRYSASPAEPFFTGGGLHTFSNFNREDDHKVLSVREAFYNSVNLVFIRLMRDIVHYHLFQRPESIARILEDSSDPRRQEYLTRFADREGSTFLYRFYRKYQGKRPEEALKILAQGVYPIPARLATVFRSVAPEASMEEFASFMRAYLPNSTLSDKTLQKLYTEYSEEAFSLADRGYIARVHPLELWTVAYLRRHPEASQSELIKASADARQEVYAWLFKTGRKNKQDKRIRILLEIEAFQEIHQAWKRLRYPFDALVPSYATAIGSSGDRPAALAELVGILLNNGVWYPSMRVQSLHFAEGTPYETLVKREVGAGEQVLVPEVAAIVRNELVGVVEEGTAQRVRGAFLRSDGSAIAVGGKTGTGDNRYDVYGPGGGLIKSRVVNRTATFVFFLGDRFFGAITAYVAGPEAAGYRFTSSLPVQVLKVLAPKLMPLIERADHGT